MKISSNKVLLLVVTYNRLPLLKECLAALIPQARNGDKILVIDNSSTDGTGEWLSTQSAVTVLTRPNRGCSPAFSEGIAVGIEEGFDWVWMMDDDSVPCPTALKVLLDFAVDKNRSEIGYLTPAVVWRDGSAHRMNVQHRIKPTMNFYSDLENYSIRSEYASFVGLLVSTFAVKKTGLPLSEYEIWYDDLEFTERINRHFKSWIVWKSGVLHNTLENHSPSYKEINAQNLFKFKRGFRNKIHVIRSREGFTLRGQAIGIAWIAVTMLRIASINPRFLLPLFLAALSGLWFCPKVRYV